MPKPLNIPKFHTKDFTVLTATMLPMALVLNYFLYGSDYFHPLSRFLLTTLVTFVYLGSGFLTYGFVAIFLRNRFPHESQTPKRILISLAIFFLMSAVYMSVLLLGYEYFKFYGYEYVENDFIKAYITLVIMNVFLTFLNEGISRFEKYRITLTETEQLKKEYMHSQLLGLKSQMNPHFLFNSLNTLSSLIQEDAETAEDFLDHMSKVYRYLLRNNDEQVVTVETELSFIRSYYYLLKARHAEGLQLSIDVSEYARNQMIPPLTLQMIFENAMNQNVISRSQPLHITIRDSKGCLEVVNNLQPKISNHENYSEVVENISNKYRLLCGCQIRIQETATERSIQLPALENKEINAA